jgi:hypothetical protein
MRIGRLRTILTLPFWDCGLDRLRTGHNWFKLGSGCGGSDGSTGSRRTGCSAAVLDHGLVLELRLIPRSMVDEQEAAQAERRYRRCDDYRGEVSIHAASRSELAACTEGSKLEPETNEKPRLMGIKAGLCECVTR